MKTVSRLDLYWGDEHVGSIHDASLLAFEYTPTWLSRAQPFAVAAIALQPGRIDTPEVQAYFESLLPEGELRQTLVTQKKASTVFALLHAIAGDTASGFVILPAGQTPGPARYEATTWEALEQRLRQPAVAAMDLQAAGARISLAGAQDKTSVALFADGVPRLPRGTAPSTHILKPDIQRLSKVWPKVWDRAANETLIMRTAAECGLPTAEVFYEPHTRACVVRRFDRWLRDDGTLGRLIQYDFCQLAGVVSQGKYEAEGGPGIAQCAELIRRYSTQPALDLRHFLRWIFFNLYVGNNDSHAKNLALYQRVDGAVTLAPFYDLMCTRLYPALSTQFAYALGGVTQPGAMTHVHLADLAQVLRMRPQFLLSEAQDLANKMPAALEAALAVVGPVLPPAAADLAQRLKQFVLSNTRKTAARFRP